MTNKPLQQRNAVQSTMSALQQDFLQTVENRASSGPSLVLPSIDRDRQGETIFNPVNFLAIYDRVTDLKPGAQRQWGKMNVVQMLNHLKIATGSGMGTYRLKDESNFLYRTFIKFLVLQVFKRLPKNAAAPKGFQQELNAELNFKSEKNQVLNVLKKAYYSSQNIYPHPLFGKMSKTEWGKLVYRHFDHHLRQFAS